MDLEKAVQKRSEKASPPSPAPKTRVHVVRFGESLSIIAQKYSLSLDDLCRMNRITPRDVIHPGQELKVQ
jgi:LysM repeat protein